MLRPKRYESVTARGLRDVGMSSACHVPGGRVDALCRESRPGLSLIPQHPGRGSGHTWRRRRHRRDWAPGGARVSLAHIGETDCVAGVVGLELRNPLGSKSARIAGEFLPIWAKRCSRDGSRPSCGVANVQLRQGFRLALWGRKGEQHGRRGCSICLAGRIRTSIAAKKIIPR
jgi:hypothetical protein